MTEDPTPSLASAGWRKTFSGKFNFAFLRGLRVRSYSVGGAFWGKQETIEFSKRVAVGWSCRRKLRKGEVHRRIILFFFTKPFFFINFVINVLSLNKFYYS